MAAGPPLTSLALGASSVADDLSYVALNDLAGAFADIAMDYRVIGGHGLVPRELGIDHLP
jgi:hypothetical protein